LTFGLETSAFIAWSFVREVSPCA